LINQGLWSAEVVSVISKPRTQGGIYRFTDNKSATTYQTFLDCYNAKSILMAQEQNQDVFSENQ
jgi:hypothetical protein